MGIINKLYDFHAIPSKNVQFAIDEEARKFFLSQCNFGLRQKPPPSLLRLPTPVGTFSEFDVMMWTGIGEMLWIYGIAVLNRLDWEMRRHTIHRSRHCRCISDGEAYHRLVPR